MRVLGSPSRKLKIGLSALITCTRHRCSTQQPGRSESPHWVYPGLPRITNANMASTWNSVHSNNCHLVDTQLFNRACILHLMLSSHSNIRKANVVEGSVGFLHVTMASLKDSIPAAPSRPKKYQEALLECVRLSIFPYVFFFVLNMGWQPISKATKAEVHKDCG
ncbi:hypothetical protein BDW59DRAFT_151323 [Aspergillus cavernicola]|uniref:Uncharacterized protein n=1 Tax=Aspergillus cavernicola TaxID=176166 RepID=A0ABR4HVY5_9EURO